MSRCQESGVRSWKCIDFFCKKFVNRNGNVVPLRCIWDASRVWAAAQQRPSKLASALTKCRLRTRLGYSYEYDSSRCLLSSPCTTLVNALEMQTANRTKKPGHSTIPVNNWRHPPTIGQIGVRHPRGRSGRTRRLDGANYRITPTSGIAEAEF